LRDRQSNSYAQTTFSENVQLEMEKKNVMWVDYGLEYFIVNLSWLCIPLWDKKILSIFG
jgi:hypothetical protein